MEYLQVFDDKKNILDEKISRDEKYDLPDGKYFMIVLLFIENDDGSFLLQKTSPARHSCIATTGGHVTFGDSALKTVIKECKEELGIDISQDDVSYVDTLKYKEYCYLETYYTKKNIDINSLTLQEEEVESVNWYTKDEINNFINNNEFREGNIAPYRKVLERIGEK